MSVGTIGSLLRKHVQGVLFISQQPGSPPRSQPCVCRLQSPGPLSLDLRPEQGGTEHPWPGKGQSGVASRGGAQGSLLGEGPAQGDRGSREEEVSEAAAHPTWGNSTPGPSWGAGLGASLGAHQQPSLWEERCYFQGLRFKPSPRLHTEGRARSTATLSSAPSPLQGPRSPRVHPRASPVSPGAPPLLSAPLSLLRLIFQTLIHRS